MLINRNVHGFSNNKKYIVGSYISTNKDQILKPLLGAVGTLGAKALTEGIPALINKIASKNKNKLLSAPPPEVDLKILEDPVYKKILQNMAQTVPIPVSNIIGSAYAAAHKRGSGIKKF